MNPTPRASTKISYSRGKGSPIQQMEEGAKAKRLKIRIQELKRFIIKGNYDGKSLEQISSLKGIAVEKLLSHGITEEFLKFCYFHPNPQLPNMALVEVWEVSLETVLAFKKSFVSNPTKWGVWTEKVHKTQPLLDAVKKEYDKKELKASEEIEALK